ncbi:carbon starvation CstA family protein [Sphingomonas sp.]|uniref:carbon starvation CstA family protein n=1 Tax=Sphingomonas sp. TaxID=28214 RepID=UPI003B3A1108
MKLWLRQLGWLAVAVVGTIALAVVATARGEPINALWIVASALCVYLIAYRFYARFIAERVLRVDPDRPTPAVRLADGLDYVATDRKVLFGHHFAAIAGAGPLVGPVLAAQMGYLPGMLWILAGVVLAGAVQDLMILFASMRRDGRSLGEIVRMEMGEVPGRIALFGTFLIMIIILAVLALIVVRALANSPWGTFTVAATIPLAIVMGVYMRWLRPGRVGEASLIGFVGLILAIVGGQYVAQSAMFAGWFTFTPVQLCWILVGYGAVASLLPVWMLLAPRDYLSTFLKIGAIAALAIGIALVAPVLQMPPITRFVDGTGPVWSGPLFPFLFITIACGAVSGFHALIASGTTPKLIASEADAKLVGYGAMLMESFVAIMALVAASIIDPGVYFAMNSPPAVVGATSETAAASVTAMGFPISAETIDATARDVGEATIVSRAGGAPTLAVGMAHVFSSVFGGKAAMAFWYHFAILFEALFILTAVDAGTRAGRFMLQDLIGLVMPRFANTSAFGPALIGTLLCVGAWGFFLYQGVTDPLGGVNTLWPLFGVSNQMLAAVALMLATVMLFRMGRARYSWVTIVPATWLVACTVLAGMLKLASPDPHVGFLAHARRFSRSLVEGEILAPAKSPAEMHRIVMNDWIDGILCILFLAILLSILWFAIRSSLRALRAGIGDAAETASATAPL